MSEFEHLLEEITRGQVYYHLTPDDYGPVVEFYPRRPISAGDDEPDDARICVSPSLAGCMVAGAFSVTNNLVLYAYATKAEAHLVDVSDVFDADVTEEHWILDPAVFVKVGELDLGKDFSKETMHSMVEWFTPYDKEDHMLLKDEVEQDLRSIEEKFHKEASRKLQVIIPRIKDVSGQGLFLVVEDEYSGEQVEEAEVDGKKIPQVKAPGNFHQVRHEREETDE
jgi:hypothetical protein